MASTRNQPVPKRIAFALRCYYVTATSTPSVKDVEEVMKKKDKDFDLLDPPTLRCPRPGCILGDL